ncbi:MAG: AAA family ATPase [Candidatus Zambryskibacteria bacterium]|nr:AAA family ATPase [Candidatus Zambryskibacteria bacterium]
MYLKSIEITGFKSFAKKSDLTFASKVSSIVGPNGSGKSNIAEAFRFVLGEQSMKSMRGKKGEDMIWNGSSEMPKAGKASVKVVFDNSSRFLPLDFSEVTLERVVHRDSVNEYYINGSQVRLRDVIELLAGAHIGASGHHIISQGEADKILNASVRERKGMIEEALGLKIYQYKKIESIKKLEKTRENIGQVESLRREIAPHIRYLKKQVEKVEKAIEFKNELLGLSVEYLKREDDYIKQAHQEIVEKKTPLLGEHRQVLVSIETVKEHLKNAEHKDAKSSELISLEESIFTIRQRKDTAVRDIGRIEGEISSQMRLIKKQEELARSNEWKTVQLRAVEDLHAQVFDLIGDLEHATDQQKISSSIQTVKGLLKAFVEMHRDTVDTTLIKEAESEIQKLGDERSVLEKNIDAVSREENEARAQYEALKHSIEKEKDTNREAEKELFVLMSREQNILSDIKTYETQESRVRILEDDFKRELTELSMLLGRDVLAFGEKHFELREGREAQEERRRKIEKIKIRLEDSGGVGGGETVKEYEEALERDQFLERELTDLSSTAESLGILIGELDTKIASEFTVGVEKINRQFSEYFAMMFGGGEAKLSVIREQRAKKKSDLDDLSPTPGIGEDEEVEEGEAGIDIEVSLPRKKVKGLIMLSGGERALTSIALLFAVSQVNPPPFIILDETDAALDEANSRKYGDMIETLSKFSQLIVITHNRETMSRAGALYGVTMGQGGVSKLLTVSFEDAVAVAK